MTKIHNRMTALAIAVAVAAGLPAIGLGKTPKRDGGGASTGSLNWEAMETHEFLLNFVDPPNAVPAAMQEHLPDTWTLHQRLRFDEDEGWLFVEHTFKHLDRSSVTAPLRSAEGVRDIAER